MFWSNVDFFLVFGGLVCVFSVVYLFVFWGSSSLGLGEKLYLKQS